MIPPAASSVECRRDVLVVDDDEGIRNTLVDILTLAGLTVAAAASAGEALAAQAAEPARVAVVDYRLPDATGLELATRLKQADADLPIVVLTGNASLETAVAAVGHVDEYLTKPVAPNRLLQTVCLGLERRRLMSENRDLLRRVTEANLTLEARVQEREAQFRDLLESAPDAMVIAAEDGRIVLANRQVERLFGWSRPSLIGSPVETLLPGLQGEHDQSRAHALELLALRADGSQFPVEVTLSPVQTADGVLVCAAIRDITDRKQAELALAHQALHDALTGLPNRVLLVDRLEQALARAARTDDKVAVLFLDVDRFKVVNDSRGHAAGDELIIGVADRLRATVRPTDTVARFGGDEFVVVCQDAETLSAAMAVADRIATALREPFRIAGEEIFLTVSVGIATADPGASSEMLLRNADAAMYRAKEQGRARCEFFDETMQTEAAARLELQTALNWAVQRDEMRVFYQPLIDIDSGLPVGVEALVRWQHPDRGIVGPADFIPLAEDAGLIVPIGGSVLKRAARDYVGWGALSTTGRFSIAVNLSAHQLRHPGLVEHVRTTLAQSRLAPQSLCLELTESALLEDLERHIGVLLALRDLGVRLALDDFGTGYSSLTYLKRFPVDLIKIDRSFVAGLGVDHCDTAIVRSIIELAHALSLTVVAEGIEQPEQLEQLRSLGCDVAQGYLFGRPEPQSLLLERLSTHRRDWRAEATVPQA